MSKPQRKLQGSYYHKENHKANFIIINYTTMKLVANKNYFL